MSSPLSAVSIEVTANDDPARREIREFIRQVNNLVASVFVDTDTSSLKKVPGEAAKAGQLAGDALGDGLSSGVEDAAGGLWRDVNGRLRNDRGQFVAAGVEAGRALGQGIEAGASSETEGLGRKLAGPIATGLGLVAIGAGIAGGAISAFGLKSAAELEQVQISFNSLTGSAEEGQRVFKELQKFAATTPFEFPEVATAAKRLLAMGQAAGIAQGDIQKVLTAIGGVASVTGGGAQALDSVTLAMGQMASSGKVTLDNLNQISESMPGFSGVAAIAAAKGITTAEAMDLISSGSLTAEDGIAALIAGMEKFPGAAGAMEAQSKTLLGTFSTFKDTLSQSLTEAFTPILPDIKNILGELTPILGGVFKDLAPALGEVLVSLGKVAGPALQALSAGFTPLFSALGEALSTIDFTALIGPLGDLGKALAPILGLAGNLIELIISNLGPAISVLAKVLGPVIAAIGGALGPVIQKTLIPAMAKVAPLVVSLAEKLGTVLGDALNELLPAILDLIPVFVDALIPALIEILPTLTPLIPLLGQLLTLFIKILVPLLNLTAQFDAFLILNVIVPIVKLLALAVGGAAEAMSALFGWISKIDWKGVGGDISDTFTGALDSAGEFFSGIGDFFVGIFKFFQQLPGKIGKFLQSLPKLLADLFADAVAGAFTAIGFGLGLIYRLVTEAPGKILGFLQSLPSTLSRLFREAFDSVVSIVSTSLDAVGNFLSALPGRAWTALLNFKNTVLGFIGDTFAAAQNSVSNGVENIIGFIRSIPGRILQFGRDLFNAGASLINNLLDGIAGFGSRAFGFIGQIVQAIKNFVNNNIIGGLETGLNRALPFNVSLPRLADGAVVDEPTVALVGEAGPEVVIPLNNPARANELADASGLRGILGGRGGGDMPVINVAVFATLGTGEVLQIVDQRVDVRLGESAQALNYGPRW